MQSFSLVTDEKENVDCQWNFQSSTKFGEVEQNEVQRKSLIVEA
jgi:hypothetical protein